MFSVVAARGRAASVSMMNLHKLSTAQLLALYRFGPRRRFDFRLAQTARGGLLSSELNLGRVKIVSLSSGSGTRVTAGEHDEGRRLQHEHPKVLLDGFFNGIRANATWPAASGRAFIPLAIGSWVGSDRKTRGREWSFHSAVNALASDGGSAAGRPDRWLRNLVSLVSRQRRKDWHSVRNGACVWIFQRREGAV